MFALKRHQRTVPLEDLVVVINTLNEDFKKEAVAYCTEQGIEHYVTESNGGPSMGKNSVLDLFEASDNDYMVLIDGDDFVTPHGVWTYKQLAQTPNCPDVIALEYQYSIRPDTGYSPEISEYENDRNPRLGVGAANTLDPDKTYGSVALAFYHSDHYWQECLAGRIIKVYEGNNHSADLCSVHQRWATHVWNYISKRENHLRLTMLSKKVAVDGYRFDLNFTVGEDTLLYLVLKRAYLDGKLTMKHLFDRYPTYIYDTRIGGIVWEEKDKGGLPGTEDYGWYLWLKKLTEEYDRYEAEGIMSIETVPRLNIRTYAHPDPDWYEGKVYPESANYDLEWPNNYIPDLMGLVQYPGRKKVFY